MTRAPEALPPSRSLAWSLGAHAAALVLLFGLSRLRWLAPPPLEIEITSPYLGDGAAKLGAPRALSAAPARGPADETTPPAPRPAVAVPPPSPASSAQAAPPPPPAPAPAPGGAAGGVGTAVLPGGAGAGADAGSATGMGHGGAPLAAFPRLLNRDEVMAGVRRLYPESERRFGREADVLLMIHIGADGTVSATEVMSSAGPAFDAAAAEVAKLMRFSPAQGLDGSAVPVRLPQPIQFRLTGD